MTVKIDNKDCSLVINDSDSENKLLYILAQNKTSEITTYKMIRESEDSSDIDTGYAQDGYYSLYRIVLDGEDGYTYENDTLYDKDGNELSFEDVKEIFKPIEILSTCNLRKCYVKTAKKILEQTGFSKCGNRRDLSQDIYLRDLLLSVYNAAQYAWDLGHYWESERLLERIQGCNGICPNECGCE